METNNQLQVEDHDLPPIQYSVPSNRMDQPVPEEKRQEHTTKVKFSSTKLTWLLIVCIAVFLVISGVSLYTALVNNEFRWYLFYPTLVCLIGSVISQVVNKGIHYLETQREKSSSK